MELTPEQILRARFDNNLKERTKTLFFENDNPEIGDIYELQLLSELHYYLKTEHLFTPMETEALLSFKDPLNVLYWCSEERGHHYSFPICELLDKINAYERFERVPFEQHTQNNTSLRERLQEANRVVKNVLRNLSRNMATRQDRRCTFYAVCTCPKRLNQSQNKGGF